MRVPKGEGVQHCHSSSPRLALDSVRIVKSGDLKKKHAQSSQACQRTADGGNSLFSLTDSSFCHDTNEAESASEKRMGLALARELFDRASTFLVFDPKQGWLCITVLCISQGEANSAILVNMYGTMKSLEAIGK